jgi:23S rRNA pseudoU1915 N3-methylase RlmH
VAKSKDTAYVFLIDFSKGRILASGFMSIFQDIKVDGRENMTLSICGNNGTHNYMKVLQYTMGQWEIN